MILILIFFYFFIFYLFFIVFKRKEGLLSTFFFFGVSFSIYNVGIPIEALITGYNSIELVLSDYESELVYLSSEKIFFILVLSNLGLLFFGTGLYFGADIFSTLKNDNLNFVRSPYIIIILLLFLLLFFFKNQILSSSDYATSYDIAYENHVFSFFVSLLTSIIPIYVGYFFLNRKISLFTGILFLTFVFYWAMFTSNKDPILLSILSLVCFFYKKLKMPSYVFILFTIFISAALILAVISFSQYRVGGDIDLIGFIENNGLLRYIEPAGPMGTLLISLDETNSFLLGKTYLDAFYIWIPKFIFPARPLDIAEVFAQKHMTGWKPGMGMGFSLLAESYLNFGLFGPIIQYFFLGLIWTYFWEFIKNMFTKADYSYFLSIYIVLGYYVLILMHRSPISFIFSVLIKSLIIFIIFYFILDRNRHESTLGS